MIKIQSIFIELMICLGLLFSELLGKPEISLRGKVINEETGEPVSNANVILLSTNIGDATDENGWFIIKDVPRGKYELLISHIGYQEMRRKVHIPQTDLLVIPIHETFFQMGEVVVTGTRTENIFRDVPVATEVVSKQDIVDSGARDVAELLEERAGTFVNTSVAGGNILSLLGIDSKYILILVDGQPVSGKFNDRVSLDQFSTATVEKIEIVKGPGSSLYGSEAMGGVVNIITRKEIDSFSLTFNTRFTGTDNQYNITDSHSGKRDLRLNWIKRREKALFNIDFDFLKANVDQANQYINIDQYDKFTVEGGVKYVLKENQRLDVQFFSYTNGEESHTRTLNAITDIRRKSLLLRHNGVWGGIWRFETVLRGAEYERKHTQTRPWGDLVNSNKSGEKQIELEENIVYKKENNSINFGLELNNTYFSSDRVKKGKQQLLNKGYYFQWHRSISSHVEAVIGTRLDQFNRMKLVSSPRLAIMIGVKERWKIRGSWGTGFRLPSFMDRYIDWNHTQFGYRIIGNPDLKPESSQGYSLGLEYYHPDRYQMSLLLYQNRFKDMINDVIIEPGLFTYQNVEKVLYRGIELQGRWNISSHWLVSWGYNYLDNRNLVTGRLVANTQPHSATMRVSYRNTDGTLSNAIKIKWIGPYRPEEYLPESGEYVRSKKKRPSIAIINVNGKIKITSLFGVAVGIQNLSDFTDQRYGPFLGRSFYVELITELK